MASPPSDWVLANLHRIREDGTVLDLASGSGRHARVLADAGLRVTAVDRDAEALAALQEARPDVAVEVVDLELGGDWPLTGQRFDGVVVTNYLHRERFRELLECVGGVLIYETFAVGNEAYGRPSRAAFLLEPGELFARLVADFEVVAYEQERREGEWVRQRAVGVRR